MTGFKTAIAGEEVPGVCGHEFKVRFRAKKLPEIFTEKGFTAALFTIIKLRININVQRGWLNEVLYIHSATKNGCKISSKHMNL